MTVLIVAGGVLICWLFYLVLRYEGALRRISHYHGDSVEELIDIAYTARKGKNWK